MKPLLLFAVALCALVSRGAELTMNTRKQVDKGGGVFEKVEKTEKLDPKKTAIVVCDMWNEHWCKGATERVGEMAPRMNEVLKKARAQGVFIIHAPSETMKFYEGTPARKRALAAAKATPKVPLQRWCYLDKTKEAALPIDDSDGGCDDEPRCKGGPPYPWTRQIAAIEIADEDAITDNEQAYFLMQERGIDNVIVMGVHANMCVLGRPFSIRQMVAQGKNVLLMRDMTDTMYNSRMRPFVNHFRGTDLVVDHIERYWAASITSADFVGGQPFRFKGDTNTRSGKKVVFMIGEPEYKTEITLPEFAKSELEPLGFKSTFVIADRAKPNDFPGLDALKDADLLVLSVRRATPPIAHMELIRKHLGAGKPLVAIRTSSHAFDAKPPEGYAAWTNFDRQILGAHYQNHYGKGPAVEIKATPEGARNSILNGVTPLPFKSESHLYRSRNLFHTATALLNGQIEGRPEIEPVAWLNTAEHRRVFYTSLGGPEDFKLPQFRSLLRNGILWTLDMPIPKGENQTAIDQDQPGALSPADASKSFTVAEGLEWEQVLAEPVVAQPLQLSFDARGRMWVVQYLQYPHPAGLKMVSRDNFWRAVYDKVPQAPPNHVRGADKITIHEDTDGDGKFDAHKTFVDGLSIVTSCAVGLGGVWVLNPPYLLFYPDANRDDVPDGAPTVHLAGFGLEDTHSVANSLRWGPDGWLYGAHGSTVTGNITRPGIDAKPVHFQGQLIWRYQPETKRFEVFAEGGGNAFGLEFDAKGRAFSGHNGGNTRGFHYVQGGYSQKGFEKHGPLSNPYTFGYFRPMAHPDVDRFTHAFVVYEGGAQSEKYEGKLFGIEPLQGRVVMSEITADGSSFKTRDIGYAVTSKDKWFRPVDIKEGPDGAIYVADWYDRNVNHYRNHEGQVDPSNGRIYRLRKGSAKIGGIQKLNDTELVDRLTSNGKFQRQAALRELTDRRAKEVAPLLRERIKSATGQTAVEYFWALNGIGAFDESLGVELLSHPEPFVRQWAARLIGDARDVSQSSADALARLAASEPNLHVRSQLASTARRLKAPEALAIVRGLANHSEDLKDIHLPLLTWWAVETHVEKNAAEILRALQDAEFLSKPAIKDFVVEKLARRFAQAGTRQDYLNCAQLFSLGAHTDKVERGFEEGIKGRSLTGIPKELLEAMKKAGVKNELIAIRLGDSAAIENALKFVSNSNSPRARRLQFVEALSEVKSQRVAELFSDIAGRFEDEQITRAAILALQKQDPQYFAKSLAGNIPRYDPETRIVAMNLVASHEESAQFLLGPLRNGAIPPKSVPQDIIAKMRINLPDESARIWGVEKKQTSGEMQVEIDRVAGILAKGAGSPYAGQKVYTMACGTCHKLFSQGGQIGPDLTTFKRDDLQNMLLNIVHPNAEIREGYVNYLATTKDGRTVTGFLADEDKQVVALRGIDGSTATLARTDIAEMKLAGFSLMPEGLLQALEEQQLRDLFAYLRSTQPLVP